MEKKILLDKLIGLPVWNNRSLSFKMLDLGLPREFFMGKDNSPHRDLKILKMLDKKEEEFDMSIINLMEIKSKLENDLKTRRRKNGKH